MPEANCSVEHLPVAARLQTGCVHLDEKGTMRIVEPAFARMLGYQIGELEGQRWTMLCTREQIALVRKTCTDSLRTRKRWEGYVEVSGADRAPLTLYATIVLQQSADGISAACECTHIPHDIGPMSIGHPSLFEPFFEHSPLLLALLDANMCYRAVNKAYCQWFDRPAAAFIGSRISDVFDESTAVNVGTHVAAVMNGAAVSYDTRIPHHSGRDRWVHANYLPNRDADGNVHGVFVFIFDIDDRKHEEIELQGVQTRRSIVASKASPYTTRTATIST